MAKEIQLRIANLDLKNKKIDDIWFNNFQDYFTFSYGNITFVTIFCENDTVINEVDKFVTTITTQIPKIKILGVDYDFVSIAEIARRTGISTKLVTEWTKENTFPNPKGLLRSNQIDIWVWVEVVDWSLKVKFFDMDENIVSYANLIAVENHLITTGKISKN